jgi:cytochrome c oxidase cbb3-type subunit 3
LHGTERTLFPAQGDRKAGSMNESSIDVGLPGILRVRPLPSGRAEYCRAGCRDKLHRRMCITFLCASVFAIATVCFAQQAQPGGGQGVHDHARRSFAARCAACHGLDGRGGEHAPAIVNTPAALARTDEALARIIRIGIPDKGMPSFHFLTNQQIEEIVRYVRVLRGSGGSSVNLKGDPAAGSELFFGEAGCSDCHMVQGKGGFTAPDLSEFGRTHSAGDIRRMIVQPDKILDPRWQLVRVATQSGRHFSGMVRNEDNFSIALLSEEGVFHLLLKSEIAEITREPRSIMPDDYGKKLTAQQLDDLASFLFLGSKHKNSRADSAGAAHTK